MVSPTRRRDAVSYLVRKHGVSERRACSVCEQHRSTQRYRPVPTELEQKLVRRMNELAARHPRYGYRRIWALLRSEGFPVNRKRIERLWRLEGHRVPPRRTKESGKKAQGSSGNAVWNRPAASPNHVWSYDFMNARTQAGSLIRILNVVDEYTRVALGCRVARSIGALDVIEELEGLFRRHGKPKLMRSDNGREFISQRRSPTGSEPRESSPSSSRRARRSRTLTSSASTARCATRGSPARSSRACSRLAWSCRPGSRSTTHSVLTAGSECARRCSMRETVERAGSERNLPHNHWTSRPASPISRLD